MDTIAARETRTQEAQIAALFVRPRTRYRAGQRVLVAVASLFGSLLGRRGEKLLATVLSAQTVAEDHPIGDPLDGRPIVRPLVGKRRDPRPLGGQQARERQDIRRCPFRSPSQDREVLRAREAKHQVVEAQGRPLHDQGELRG